MDAPDIVEAILDGVHPADQIHLGGVLDVGEKFSEVSAGFGLRFELPDYLVELYKSLKNDLPAFNGAPSWTRPATSSGPAGAS